MDNKYGIHKRKKNLLTMLEMLEDKEISILELTHELRCTKNTVYNYIKVLKDNGINVYIAAREPFRYKLEYTPKVKRFKKFLEDTIDYNYVKVMPKEFKDNKDYIRFLLISINFQMLTKKEAVEYVQKKFDASLYDIYLVYEDLRAEYLKSRTY